MYASEVVNMCRRHSRGSRSAACFSARLLWRDEGKGELYTYLPPYTVAQFAATEAVCSVPPLSDCNVEFGASVGRGAFRFATGAWTTISQRVRLNDVGEANGELELFANGESVISVGGLILRDNDEGRIRGMQMQTFFGGMSDSVAVILLCWLLTRNGHHRFTPSIQDPQGSRYLLL